MLKSKKLAHEADKDVHVVETSKRCIKLIHQVWNGTIWSRDEGLGQIKYIHKVGGTENHKSIYRREARISQFWGF